MQVVLPPAPPQDPEALSATIQMLESLGDGHRALLAELLGDSAGEEQLLQAFRRAMA